MKKYITLILIFSCAIANSQTRNIAVGDTVPDFVDSYNSNMDSIMGGGTDIKPYWQIYNEWHTAHKLDVLCRDGNNDYNFILLLTPDVHTNVEGLDRVNEFIQLNNFYDDLIKGWVIAGDWTYESNAEETHQDAYDDMQSFLSRVGSYEVPLFYALGNHEGFSFYSGDTSHALSKQQQKTYIMDSLALKETNLTFNYNGDDADGCYYFTDYTSDSMRVVVLDDYDVPQTVDADTFIYRQKFYQSFSGDQLQWMVDTALKIPSVNWHVIIINGNDIVGTNAAWDSSHYAMKEILNDFQSQGNSTVKSISDNSYNITYDFSSINGFNGELVGVFFGEDHTDQQSDAQGYWNIGTNSLETNSNNHTRNEYSTTWDNADILIVNKTLKAFYLISYGAGAHNNAAAIDNIDGDRGLDGTLTY